MIYSACAGVKNVEIKDDLLEITADSESQSALNESLKTLQNIVNEKYKNLKIVVKNAMSGDENFDILDLVKKIFSDKITYIN